MLVFSYPFILLDAQPKINLYRVILYISIYLKISHGCRIETSLLEHLKIVACLFHKSLHSFAILDMEKSKNLASIPWEHTNIGQRSFAIIVVRNRLYVALSHLTRFIVTRSIQPRIATPILININITQTNILLCRLIIHVKLRPIHIIVVSIIIFIRVITPGQKTD